MPSGPTLKETIAEHYTVDDIVGHRSDSKIALIADSGLGKSTLLYEVFVRACREWKEGDPVPFLFTSGQGSKVTEGTLRSVLAERLASACAGDDALRVRRAQIDRLALDLAPGDLFLIFDALDQIADSQPLLGCLGSMTLRHCRVLISSRPSAWATARSALAGYTTLRLVEFDRARIEQFFGEYDQAALRTFSEDFLAIPILAHLTRRLLKRTPDALVQVRSRADLYRELFRDLPEREQDRAILGKRRPEDAIQDLRVLSFESLRRNHLGQVPRDAAKEILTESKLNDLERLQFILSYIETGDDIVFRHRSFQEFLAAETMVKMLRAPGGIDALRPYLIHPNWEEPVKFLAGTLDTAELETLLRAILEPHGDPPLILYKEHLRLAALCLHEARAPAPRASEWLLEEIESLFSSNRDEAFSLLITWGEGPAETRLLAALLNEDAQLRSSAAEALGEIGSERAVEPLLSALKDAEAEVRWSAAEALGEIGSERAVEPLLSALKEGDEGVRSSAAVALGEISGSLAEVVLELALASWRDEQSRSPELLEVIKTADRNLRRQRCVLDAEKSSNSSPA